MTGKKQALGELSCKLQREIRKLATSCKRRLRTREYARRPDFKGYICAQCIKALLRLTGQKQERRGSANNRTASRFIQIGYHYPCQMNLHESLSAFRHEEVRELNSLNPRYSQRQKVGVQHIIISLFCGFGFASSEYYCLFFVIILRHMTLSSPCTQSFGNRQSLDLDLLIAH